MPNAPLVNYSIKANGTHFSLKASGRDKELFSVAQKLSLGAKNSIILVGDKKALKFMRPGIEPLVTLIELDIQKTRPSFNIASWETDSLSLDMRGEFKYELVVTGDWYKQESKKLKG